ncbi:MAG TPA: cbb3-type cytochrome c oxidase subunit I, partial [Longimicrobiaceae bacterium]|nr:cbb3-type cytochrome c oxidase subunit I [Longimicrobiaceae bacterium]
LTSYTLVVLAMFATGVVAFGLWVHHMFTTGLSPVAMGFFAAASALIAIPSGVQIFVWISTLWTGRPVFRTPLLFVLGFIVIFVLGGLTGVMVGAVPFDWQVHDSYFVVAHFHYVLIGGVVFPFYAALYYWLPKITGRMLSERLGKINFWAMFVFFNVAFFPMHISGLLGMPRRVYTYQSGLGWDAWNLLSSVGAFGFGLGAFLIVINFFWSLKFGEKAGPNPWGADTLEWWVASPPPDAQYKFIPFIRSRHPLWEQDSFEPRDETQRKLMEPLRSKPTGWRGALVVSVVDAEPLAVVKMPGPTIWPFVMSIGFVVIFAGALVENVWIGGAGAVTTLAALIGWFRPEASEEEAIAEIGTDSAPDKLPLAVAGPLSNGWWGTLIFLLVLAIALACFVGSYFYLGGGPDQWPPHVPALRLPIYATVAALAGAGAILALPRGVHRASRALRCLGTVGALALFIASVWLSFRAWTGMGLVPVESAYASAFIGLLVFQWIVSLILVAMLSLSLLWALFDPADPRGHAVTLNAVLVGYFAAASCLVVFATLYLTPRFW